MSMAFHKIFFVLVFAGLLLNPNSSRATDNVIASSKKELAMEIKNSAALRAGSAFMATLYSHNAAEATISFTNNKGETVRSVQQNLSQGATFIKFNLGDLPSGLYFLTVQTGTQQTKKAVYIQ